MLLRISVLVLFLSTGVLGDTAQSYDNYNPAEDTLTQYTVYASESRGRAVVLNIGPHGNDTRLICNDLHAVFFITSHSSDQCRGFKVPGNISLPTVPDVSGLPLVGDTVLQGHAVEHRRQRLFQDSVVIGAYVDKHSGKPLMITNAGQEGEILMLTTPPPPGPNVFEVPAFCPPPQESSYLERELSKLELEPEIHERIENMQANDRLISEHNRRGSSHRLAHNRFSSIRFSTFASTRLMTPILAEDVPPTPSHVSVFRGKPNASSVDRRLDGFVSSVRDQGKCGSCWSFATSAAIETNAAMAVGNTTASIKHLAPQKLLDCIAPSFQAKGIIECKGCYGGWPPIAMDYIKTVAPLSYEDNYPYAEVDGTACQTPAGGVGLSDYAVIPAGDVDSMAAAVEQHGSIVAIVQVLPDFMFYTGGIYSDDKCDGRELSHAVTIVGYGTETDGTPYWIVKNSFGKLWGENGYFRMARGVNMCGIEAHTVVPIV